MPKLPVVPARAGDGCAGKLVLDTQGYAAGEPVLARVEVDKQRVTVSTLTLADGKRAQYKGSLTESLCDQPHPELLVNVSGTLSPTKAPKSSLGITLARNDYFTTDRDRRHLETSDESDGDVALELWETPPERLPLRDKYQKALKSADDIEALLESSRGTLLVGALEVGSRNVRLSELSKDPLALRHRSDQGPSCEGHTCGLELTAFDVSPLLSVVVVVRRSEHCGAKCAFDSEGALWTLGPQGFVLGASLPSTDDMPGGLTYEGRSSHTALCWVDGDGKPPLEILVEHTDDEGHTTSSIVGFDPDEHTYSRTEELPVRKGRDYAVHCGGNLATF